MLFKLSGWQTRTNVTERYLKFIRWQEVKGLMGATSSIVATQQISIQYRKVTWENISCVSKRQGEKWQLAVPLYWAIDFVPGRCGALGALRLLVALFSPFWEGGWEDNHAEQVTRMCGGSLHVFSIILFVLRRCPRDATSHQEKVKCKGKETRTHKTKQKWREDLSAPCLSPLTSGGESVACKEK